MGTLPDPDGLEPNRLKIRSPTGIYQWITVAPVGWPAAVGVMVNDDSRPEHFHAHVSSAGTERGAATRLGMHWSDTVAVGLLLLANLQGSALHRPLGTEE